MDIFPTVVKTFHKSGVIYEEKATYNEKLPRSIINVTISKAPSDSSSSFMIVTPPIPNRPYYSVMDSSWRLRSTEPTYISARHSAVELLGEAHIDQQQAQKLIEGSTAHLRNLFPLENETTPKEGVWEEITIPARWQLSKCKYLAIITYLDDKDQYRLTVSSVEGLMTERVYYALGDAKRRAEGIINKAIIDESVEKNAQLPKKTAIVFSWKKVTDRFYCVMHTSTKLNSASYNGSVMLEVAKSERPFNATLRANDALILNKNYITASEARRSIEEAIKNHLLANAQKPKDSLVVQLADAMK